MQLFALDDNDVSVCADEALKQSRYFCLECAGPLKVRGGLHRRNHFYHLQSERICRQNGKSLVHLQVQCAIRDRLPEGECLLEKRFPEIGRIADVVWEARKIIFEVQCSDITAVEVQERNRDYARAGYEVVWILHDHRYNRWRMTAAEFFLLGSTHYYTNIGVDGSGVIYDQYALIQGGVKQQRSISFPIDVFNPLDINKLKKCAHRYLEQRLQKWHLAFGGDLLDLHTQVGFEELRSVHFPEIVEVEPEELFPRWSWKRLFWRAMRCFCGGYKRLLRYFVEKACR